MKLKILIILCICMVILGGCNMGEVENTDKDIVPSTTENNIQEKNTFQDKITTMSPINLNTEDGIREYLQGDWVYDHYYNGNVICKMNIDKDLNVQLSFENTYSDEPKGDYSGKIKFDRIYANMGEASDLLCIELIDTDSPGGDFFFLHRTIYDGKRVMSWFFAGNGNCIFDVADFTGDFINTSEEIIFEKVTGEISQLAIRKNDEFYAVYWGEGHDGQGLWLDDVWWTPSEDEEFPTLYPEPMVYYENEVPGSILYSIVPGEISEVLGEDLTVGCVYFVQTDESGSVKYFISAERKKFLEESLLEKSLYDSLDPEIQNLVLDIILKDIVEIQEYLNMGMSILFTGETTTIDGEDCYDVILGTNHVGSFIREIFYSVNIINRQVYRYDVFTDTWALVAVG